MFVFVFINIVSYVVVFVFFIKLSAEPIIINIFIIL
jgi:hypothetical protein